MPVGLSEPVSLLPVRGIRLAACASGIKSDGQSDLVLLVADEGTQSAAVFTKNAYCAAPVEIAKKHMQHASSNALLINSGNANAGTGEQGEQDALMLCQHVAQGLGMSTQQVLPFSTGVISEALPVEVMQSGIDQLIPALSEDNWLPAAIDNETVTITGISKGSGMIHPDMATMLAFVATDAAVDPYSLQQLVESVCNHTFNCITVDGDTSTNDSFVFMTTGAVNSRLLSPSHPEWDQFVEAVEMVALHLAQAIIRRRQ